MKQLARIFILFMLVGFSPLFAGGNSESSAPAGSKSSGKVVVYMPSPAGLADKLAAGFEAKTGIKVEQFQGTTGEILARLETEAANPQADVVILASWADGLAMKKQGKIISYAPQNSNKMHSDWKDADNTIFGTPQRFGGWSNLQHKIIPHLVRRLERVGGSALQESTCHTRPGKIRRMQGFSFRFY